MDKLYERLEKVFYSQNFIRLIGAKPESVEPGKVVISCECKEELLQQQGVMHGGVIATLADVACGGAAMSVLPEDKHILTAEFKLNMLRPVVAEKVIATGTVLKAGKTIVVCEAEVTDADSGKLLAKMTATVLTSHLGANKD